MLKGRKLAMESAKLCKDITNFLITNGINITLPDTAYILKESYAISSLYIRKLNTNAKVIGAMILFSQNILKDWLISVFSECDKAHDFNKGVDSVIQELPEFFVNWLKELAEDKSELKGGDFCKWYPAANAHFLGHVSFYIHSKFGRTPEKFEPFLLHLLNRMMKKTLFFWDRLSLVASLEKDLPSKVVHQLKEHK
ncbi:MAG: hypothetical protein COX40_06130 [Candidatus Omnitrophica bacterium CG23_combo_of_CG06-09_8_20_14_all_40_11]|nr:MAG: hypothetical protein COX40_06130 [Candidatus Omnitrophica bacterium CG23_combo_of_CG06-09_8_20_14_all_40_11]